MQLTVLLFGASADAAGATSISVSVAEGATCAELKFAIMNTRPELAPFVKAGRVAVNHAFAEDSRVVRPADEIALIAMVSGG